MAGASQQRGKMEYKESGRLPGDCGPAGDGGAPLQVLTPGLSPAALTGAARASLGRQQDPEGGDKKRGGEDEGMRWIKG